MNSLFVECDITGLSTVKSITVFSVFQQTGIMDTAVEKRTCTLRRA